MRIAIELPEVYVKTEDSMKIVVTLGCEKVKRVTYVSMDNRCFEDLEFEIEEGAEDES